MQQKTFELTFNSVEDVNSAHIHFKAQQFYIVSFEHKCEKRAKKNVENKRTKLFRRKIRKKNDEE